ncbi:MAG: hypothetical protein LQ350_002425 [Teloschistes chrysophthalmus]|nr:MAG: hypothetical protein LQ350_002425 [Niorma chrysophthalma]
METPSGNFFTMPAVNEHLKAIVTEWKDFLAGPASRTVLKSEDGWTSPASIAALKAMGNYGEDHYTFEQMYKCPDVSQPTFGFISWNDFFVRKFHDGIRPVPYPDNIDDHPLQETYSNSPDDPHPHNQHPSIINNNHCIIHACESHPLPPRHQRRPLPPPPPFHLPGQKPTQLPPLPTPHPPPQQPRLRNHSPKSHIHPNPNPTAKKSHTPFFPHSLLPARP